MLIYYSMVSCRSVFKGLHLLWMNNFRNNFYTIHNLFYTVLHNKLIG